MSDPTLLPSGDDLRVALGVLVPAAMVTLASDRPSHDVWFAEGDRPKAEWSRVSGEAGPLPTWLVPWSNLLGSDQLRAPNGMARALVIADPIASAVSVVWWVESDAATGARLDGDLRGSPLLGMLRALIDGSLGWPSQTLGSLQRRPGIQLVLVASKRLDQDLEMVAREIYRQAGPYLLDVQVRLIFIESGGAPASHLDDVLAYHLPVEPWPTSAPWTEAEQEEFGAKLGDLERRLRESLAGLEADATSAAALFRLADRVSAMSAPGVAPREQAEADAPGTERARPMAPVHLRWALKLRRWDDADRPLRVSLGPVTLALGENASGKTSLAEAMSAVHLGAPRPRMWIPEHADRWGEAPIVELEALGEQGDDGGPTAIAASHLLPLFADDADLAASTAGDLSVASWAGLHGAGVMARQWSKIACMVRVLEAELPDLQPKTRAGKDIVGWTWVPRWMMGVIKAWLWQDSSPELEAARQAIRGRESRLYSAAMPFNSIPDFATYLQVHIPPGGSRWADVANLDAALGGNTALLAAAWRVAASKIEELRRELTITSERLEDVLFRHAAFAKLIDRYLSQDLHPPKKDVRANTATVVRLGQAGRLARWLAGGGVDLPLLLVDEPTLGQDDAASGRALARLLRLSRKVEAVRRARWTSGAAECQPKLLTARVDERGLRGLDEVATWASGGLASTLAPLGAPLPPQVVALSHREQTLAAVAELEGVTLTAPLRADLQALIPGPWWSPLSRSIKDAVPEGHGSRCSPLLLRASWPPAPDQLWRELALACAPKESASWRKWWNLLPGQLAKLGMFEIASEVSRVPKVVGWSSDDKNEVNTPPVLVETALRLIAWLASNDLLTAPLLDPEREFEPSTVRMLEIPARGGDAEEIGPTRLRRIGPVHDLLPELPSSWRACLDALPGGSGTHPDPWPVWLTFDESDLPAGQRGQSLGWIVEQTGLRLAEEVSEAALTARLHGRELKGMRLCAWSLDVSVSPASSEYAPWSRAVSLLQDRLVKRRLLRIQPNATVRIALCSDSPEDAGPKRPPHFRLFVPRGGTELEHEQMFEVGLRRLQAATASTKPPLEFALRCTMPIAMLAGSVFHRQTGYPAIVAQQLSNDVWTAWPLTVDPAAGAGWDEVKWVEQTDDPVEIHLAISVTHRILEDVQRWRGFTSSPPTTRCSLIHATVGKPGRDSVPNPEAAVRLARDLLPALDALRPNRSIPIRIFLSVPNVLAMAIGRESNAMGRFLVMDWDKEARTYKQVLTI